MPPEHHETQPSAEIVRAEAEARSAGEIAFRICRGQPSAEIVRGCQMQVRLRFGPVARNPLRRSCASKAQNAGEIAFWICRGQPSAEIVRVEGAKCR